MQFGDVCIVDLPAVGGHEQSGQRPAILVQSGHPPYSGLSTVVVVPFTSQLKAQIFAGTILIEPDPSNGLRVASVALVFQIRVIDRRRVGRKIGELIWTDMMALRRRRALLGGMALTASALGGAACTPPAGPRAVTAAEIYVGLARERAIAIVDAATDRVQRRISLAPLGRTGITGQIAVGPTGDAAVLPLVGVARDVGIVQHTDAAAPARRRADHDCVSAGLIAPIAWWHESCLCSTYVKEW